MVQIEETIVKNVQRAHQEDVCEEQPWRRRDPTKERTPERERERAGHEERSHEGDAMKECLGATDQLRGATQTVGESGRRLRRIQESARK